MFLILVHVTFFSSRCMLELKFAIYHRAASLFSQASSVDVCNIGRRIIDQTRLSSNTNCIPNSAILHNNYISLLNYLCACINVKKKVMGWQLEFYLPQGNEARVWASKAVRTCSARAATCGVKQWAWWTHSTLLNSYLYTCKHLSGHTYTCGMHVRDDTDTYA